MSSGAATRTSIGNGMREPELSIQSRRRRMTSTTCSRGTAYSDSRKTTLRSEQNTLYDASTYSRADRARDASWLIRGTRPGRSDREPVGQLEDLVGQQFVVDPSRGPADRGCADAGRDAVVALGQRDVGVREPVELEVIVAVGKVSSKPVRTSPEGSGISWARRRNAGTHCRVSD